MFPNNGYFPPILPKLETSSGTKSVKHLIHLKLTLLLLYTVKSMLPFFVLGPTNYF